jgi:hypothetical protein
MVAATNADISGLHRVGGRLTASPSYTAVDTVPSSRSVYRLSPKIEARVFSRMRPSNLPRRVDPIEIELRDTRAIGVSGASPVSLAR